MEWPFSARGNACAGRPYDGRDVALAHGAATPSARRGLRRVLPAGEQKGDGPRHSVQARAPMIAASRYPSSGFFTNRAHSREWLPSMHCRAARARGHESEHGLEFLGAPLAPCRTRGKHADGRQEDEAAESRPQPPHRLPPRWFHVEQRRVLRCHDRHNAHRHECRALDPAEEEQVLEGHGGHRDVERIRGVQWLSARCVREKRLEAELDARKDRPCDYRHVRSDADAATFRPYPGLSPAIKR